MNSAVFEYHPIRCFSFPLSLLDQNDFWKPILQYITSAIKMFELLSYFWDYVPRKQSKYLHEDIYPSITYNTKISEQPKL